MVFGKLCQYTVRQPIHTAIPDIGNQKIVFPKSKQGERCSNARLFLPRQCTNAVIRFLHQCIDGRIGKPGLQQRRRIGTEHICRRLRSQFACLLTAHTVKDRKNILHGQFGTCRSLRCRTHGFPVDIVIILIVFPTLTDIADGNCAYLICAHFRPLCYDDECRILLMLYTISTIEATNKIKPPMILT